MEWDGDQRDRWLIAYWCLYHAGSACWLSEHEGTEFWSRLMVAAVNEEPTPEGGRWPRGHERRHWRGYQAVQSCEELAARYGNRPQDMVSYVAHDMPDGPKLPFTEVSRRVQEHRGFGPWIAFKVGDMLDRLEIAPVNFANADVFMFKDPTMAAEMLYAQKAGMDPQLVRDGSIRVKPGVIPEVVSYLTEQFKDLTAPPIHDRPIGLQEVETVLCKWKSSLGGHYPPYNDINEIRDGLTGWADHSSTARSFLYNMPAGKIGADAW